MPFWNSSAPRFLDREAVLKDLRRLAETAALNDPRIRRIILFGSLATRRATPRSDADLLIVLADHPKRSIDRIPEYLEAFSRGPLPVDVFPWTEKEVEDRRREGDLFLKRIESEGIELYKRLSGTRSGS